MPPCENKLRLYAYISTIFFFFFSIVYYQAWAKMQLFVGFDIFKTILKGLAIYDYVSLPEQSFD